MAELDGAPASRSLSAPAGYEGRLLSLRVSEVSGSAARSLIAGLKTPVGGSWFVTR